MDLSAVDKLAARLSTGPSLAYAATKTAVNAAALPHLAAALAQERAGQMILLGTATRPRGSGASGEKRAPHFTGE